MVSLIKFMIDILSILPNFLLVIIGTPQVLVPPKNIKQFSWGLRISFKSLRNYFPVMIVWPYNGATIKSKLPNHSPTFKGVEWTTLIIGFTTKLTTLNVAIILSGLLWSVVAFYSLTKLWVSLVYIKATSFNTLMVSCKKRTTFVSSHWKPCSWTSTMNFPNLLSRHPEPPMFPLKCVVIGLLLRLLYSPSKLVEPGLIPSFPTSS